LTFDLITGDLIKIGHDGKSMVIGHDLENLPTKFEKFLYLHNIRRPVERVELVIPIKVGQ